MKVLITGVNGFLGKNLSQALIKRKDCEILGFDVDTPPECLPEYARVCDFVYNFAAVHRPKDVSEFELVNHLFLEDLLGLLKTYKNTCPVLYTSTIQADNGSPYGESKLAAERSMFAYEKETGARAVVYRLTNTFGKWATPNHHSVVATFCYNVNRGIPITVSNRDAVMHFYYVDDVIDAFVSQLVVPPAPSEDGIYRLPPSCVYEVTLGRLADLIAGFGQGKLPEESDGFETRLFLTYNSYEPE